MGPEAACTAGISHDVIRIEVSLKSISSIVPALAGELPLLEIEADVGDADVDSCVYSQLSLRSEQ